MGVYPNHGIEYFVKVKATTPQETISNLIHNVEARFSYQVNYSPKSCLLRILKTSKTDDRLTASTYYKSREHDWFSDLHFRTEYVQKITEVIDVSLTKIEQNMIDFIQAQLGDDFESKGWYEVNYIQVTF